MRILFLSDIHGVPAALDAALAAGAALGYDKIALLGDLLYHGPRNGVPNFYDPVKVAEMLNAHKDEIVAVRGNCDAEVDQMMVKFPITADYQVLDAGNKKFFLTHGHLWNEWKLPPIGIADVLVHGHTHVPELKTLECGTRRAARRARSATMTGRTSSTMSFDAVILANGDFPKKGGAAWEILAGAKRVVACDGASDAYCRRFGKSPFAVVGDMDSIGHHPEGSEIVTVPDQSTNDLSKAVAWCRAKGLKKLVVVGAMGKREDHLLGNVFRALDLGVEIVTEFGRFVPVVGKASFRIAKGMPVSVFAVDPATRMTSKGLEWPLDGVKFKNLYCATLNRASAARVTLAATKPVLVYIGS